MTSEPPADMRAGSHLLLGGRGEQRVIWPALRAGEGDVAGEEKGGLVQREALAPALLSKYT